MRLAALSLSLVLAGPAAAAPPKPAPQNVYAKRPEVASFVRDMVQRHGFVERELTWMFARLRRIEPVLQAIQPPTAEKPRSWAEYRAMFVNERRIGAGIAFWNAHRKALERAEAEYGVPAQIIVGIIGVETFYGRNTGRWRVVDALATLAFDYPPRAEFFRDELTSYLLLARDTGTDVFSVRGSYAGAIGIPQFMPGSVRRYGVDFDRDGAVDLQRSAADAIGSVANFLRQHGWQPQGAVSIGARVSGEGYRAYLDGVEPKYTLGELARAGIKPLDAEKPPQDARFALIELETPGQPSDFRLGLQNFHALTRYNRSTFYAQAVADLAAELARGRGQDPGR